MAEYKLLKTEGRAKRAEFHTVHGTIQTPVFMNVGTIGAIKGAVSTMDLQQIGTQVELSNTYHLHVGASTLARNKNYYKPQKCGLFYVKFYLFLCCTELYFIFICDIMRYETQL